MSTFYSIGTLAEPLFQSLRHSHHTWELCLYTVGEGSITAGTELIPFQPGTIVCLPPEIPHDETSINGCNLFYIHTDILYEEKTPVPIFHDSPDQRFQRLATLLYQEFLLQEPGWQDMTQRLFDSLVCYLHRWHASRAHPLVEQLLHVIRMYFHDPCFQIGSVMASLPMSSDHLRHLFEQATGKTPIQYVTSLRMNEAKQLLQTRSFSVKEVARRVGYPDPYYFSRLFHKINGLRPSEYADQERL